MMNGGVKPSTQCHGAVLSLDLFCSEFSIWILVRGTFLCGSKLSGMYVVVLFQVQLNTKFFF